MRSIFLKLALLSGSLLLSSHAMAVKPIKVQPPATDVDCVGCVDTTDIEDGAVTLDKLGDDVINAFAPLVWIDGDGNILGKSIDEFASIQSSTGYIFFLWPTDGDFATRQDIFYENIGCTGQAYRNTNAYPGTVYRSLFDRELYYTEFTIVPETITIKSIETSSGCSNGDQTHQYIEVFPNDPEITGVPNAQYMNGPFTRQPLF